MVLHSIKDGIGSRRIDQEVRVVTQKQVTITNPRIKG